MTTTGYPRLTIDLDAVAEKTRLLAARLRGAGFALVGVTKSVDGEPRVGQAMLEAGCSRPRRLSPARLARLAAASLGPLTLIRAPQPDELEAVARVADRVLLSDVGAARVLGEHAPGAPIQILLTVDLGDRREGVLPDAAPAVAAAHRLRCRASRSPASASTSPACPGSSRPRICSGRPRTCSPSAPVLRRRAAALARRHLRAAASRRLPRRASAPRSAPAAGRSTATTSSAAPASPASSAPTRCSRRSCSSATASRRRPRGPAGCDAFGHVPEPSTCRTTTRGTPARPGAPRHGARRPAALAARRLARRRHQRRERAHHARSRSAPATRCRSPWTTTPWCEPSPRRSW